MKLSAQDVITRGETSPGTLCHPPVEPGQALQRGLDGVLGFLCPMRVEQVDGFVIADWFHINKVLRENFLQQVL